MTQGLRDMQLVAAFNKLGIEQSGVGQHHGKAPDGSPFSILGEIGV